MPFEYATNESTGTVHLSNPGSLWSRTICGRSVVDLEIGDETLHGNNATCAVCRAGRERHTFAE